MLQQEPSANSQKLDEKPEKRLPRDFPVSQAKKMKNELKEMVVNIKRIGEGDCSPTLEIPSDYLGCEDNQSQNQAKIMCIKKAKRDAKRAANGIVYQDQADEWIQKKLFVNGLHQSVKNATHAKNPLIPPAAALNSLNPQAAELKLHYDEKLNYIVKEYARNIEIFKKQIQVSEQLVFQLTHEKNQWMHEKKIYEREYHRMRDVIATLRQHASKHEMEKILGKVDTVKKPETVYQNKPVKINAAELVADMPEKMNPEMTQLRPPQNVNHSHNLHNIPQKPSENFINGMYPGSAHSYYPHHFQLRADLSKPSSIQNTIRIDGLNSSRLSNISRDANPSNFKSPSESFPESFSSPMIKDSYSHAHHS